MDFATDAKPTKRAAREMLRMTLRINEETIAKLPAGEGGRAAVTCYTCHRGLPKPPLRLHEELLKAGASGEGGGALARLEQLRKEHGEAGHYDFRAKSLWIAGRRVGLEGRVDEGLALVRLAIEREPNDASAHAALGQLLLKKGDPPAAVKSFQRALELAPGLPEAEWGLRQAGTSPEPAPKP
jgi:tetratricopeptide (TPR) repeat protein